MNRIIISTSIPKLNSILKTNLDKLEQFKSRNFVGFCEINKTFVNDIMDKQIILINDNFKEFTEGFFNKGTDYFLHHTNKNGLSEKQDELFDNLRICTGRHEVGEANINETKYPKVFEIIFDNENDKLNRIIQFLFPTLDEDTILNEKLDFLHNCLIPENLCKIKCKSEWQVDSEFKKLKELKCTDPFDDNYIEALTTVRDKLLNEY